LKKSFGTIDKDADLDSAMTQMEEHRQIIEDFENGAVEI
jgi:hypothetical protein